MAHSPSPAHSPQALASLEVSLPPRSPQGTLERCGPHRQQGRTPAVLSGRRWTDVSLCQSQRPPKTPVAWGPASPNLITHPSRTLARDGTPRPGTVPWAAGMLTSHGEKSRCCRPSPGPKQAGEAPNISGHCRARGTETAVLESPRTARGHYLWGLERMSTPRLAEGPSLLPHLAPTQGQRAGVATESAGQP